MCRLLIVASTETEIQNFLDSSCLQTGPQQYRHKDFSTITILITGIGMAGMTLHLSRFLASSQVEQSINIGFCGSFDHQIQLGSLVYVQNDVFAEIGVSDEIEHIIPFDRLLTNEAILKHLNIFQKPKLTFHNFNDEMKSVKGITVNTCTGDIRRAEHLVSKFDAEVESMEGAAFFMTCNSFNIPCQQIRAVSNHIPGRNPDRWNVHLAQRNLSEFLSGFIIHYK